MSKKIMIMISAFAIAGCASNKSECHCHEYIHHRPNVTVHSDGGPCKVIFVRKGCEKRVIRKVSEYEEF